MKSQRAFSIIELIFVILIMGILAYMALPKLAATRDDAHIAKSIMNLSIAIEDIGSSYTAEGSLDLTATNAPLTGNCFRVISNPTANGIVVVGAIGDAPYCPDAVTIATRNGLIGEHLFGGSAVSQ